MFQILCMTEMGRPESVDRLEELIRMAVAGNRQALEELLLAIERRVYLFAWRLVGNATAAEDVAQEALLKVAGNLGRYRSGTRFWSWVYRIVVNQVHDCRRRQKFPPAVEPKTAAYDVERQEQLWRVEEALSILTPKEREAVMLLDVEGYSSREAAALLGTLAITVRTRAAHARMKLRRHLSRYYPELAERP